jgi:hypothetical protein
VLIAFGEALNVYLWAIDGDPRKSHKKPQNRHNYEKPRQNLMNVLQKCGFALLAVPIVPLLALADSRDNDRVIAGRNIESIKTAFLQFGATL